MEETILEEIKGKMETPNHLTATAIDMDPSQILHTVFFSYKGKDYKVIKLVRTRIGATFELGVEYQALYDVGPLDWSGSFVRTVPDFLLKFTPTPKES
jgi:hypothetical protein